MLASTYVREPSLINGKKYDLRVYVLVTSFCPLKIYVYSEGLVRFATEPYSAHTDSLDHKFVHLTNSSVNKRNTGKFIHNNHEAGQAQPNSVSGPPAAS